MGSNMSAKLNLRKGDRVKVEGGFNGVDAGSVSIRPQTLELVSRAYWNGDKVVILAATTTLSTTAATAESAESSVTETSAPTSASTPVTQDHVGKIAIITKIIGGDEDHYYGGLGPYHTPESIEAEFVDDESGEFRTVQLRAGQFDRPTQEQVREAERRFNEAKKAHILADRERLFNVLVNEMNKEQIAAAMKKMLDLSLVAK